jgi:hypothetical protein
MKKRSPKPLRRQWGSAGLIALYGQSSGRRSIRGASCYAHQRSHQQHHTHQGNKTNDAARKDKGAWTSLIKKQEPGPRTTEIDWPIRKAHGLSNLEE